MKTTQKIQSLLAILLTLVPLLSPAANLTWDANTGLTGAQDGSGTWDAANTNWWTGTANGAWNSVTPDAAFIGSASGNAGTITLGANIVSANLRFNAPGLGNYTIAGGGFTLGLTNRGIYPAAAATISATIVGGPLTISHGPGNAPSGLLTLSGNNLNTGGVTIGENANNPDGQGAAFSTAALRINSGLALGAGAVSFNGQGNQTSPRLELVGGITVTNPASLAGRNNQSEGIIGLSGANTFAGTVTGGAGGQYYGFRSEAANGLTLSNVVMNASATRNYALTGSGSGAANGIFSGGAAGGVAIVKSGSGTWSLGGANTYVGLATIGAGTLTLDYTAQNNSKLPDAGVLNLAGGTLNLNNGSHTEVVGSATVAAGHSAVTRAAGFSTVRLNTINRSRGGVVNFGAASIADTDTLNVNGILGGYATVGGADWAINSTAAADGPITAYTGYTDIAATGSTIADGAASNVRLNSSGGGGNIALGAATTTINTLLQNTTTAATVNNAGGTLRLGATGGVLLPAAAQSLTIGTAPDSGTLTAGGADNTAGEVILINNSANAVTVNSVVADNGSGIVSLTKAGSGSATLAGNNTHTGTNIVAGGTLNVSADSNFGTIPGAATPGQIVLNGGTLNATTSFTLDANRGMFLGAVGVNGHNGGAISVASGQTLTYSGVVAGGQAAAAAGLTMTVGPGSLTKSGAGTLILGGINTYAGSTYINGGTLSIGADANLGGIPGCYMPENLVLNGGALQVTVGFTMSANRGVRLGPVGGAGTGTFNIDASQTLTFNGQISDNWNGTGALTKTGDGILALGASVNDYSGNTTISGGTLQLNHGRAIPNGTGKGSIINNGVLALNGVTYAANAISGSGSLDSIGAGVANFIVGSLNTSDAINWSITQNGGGPLNLVKTGSGTFTYSGSSAHSGSTLINSGTLALTGSAAMGSTTNIVVSSGATFSVSGLAGGTLTLNSGQIVSGAGTVLGTLDTVGGGAIAPGASAGTLTMGGLTLNGGSLNYELANVTTTGAGVNDYTIVTGLLNVSGPTALNLTYLNALPAGSGKYTLISYNTFAGDVNNISVPSGFTISNNTALKTIELLINHVPVSLTWRGDGVGNLWDINTTANWNANTTTFFNGDTANFDNTGSNTPAINITTPIVAAAVNVNASQDYNFTGASLAATTLTKGGSGTLTLENDNLYTSGGTISGGTLQVGNAGTTGTIGGGSLTNNAALVFNRADTITVTNEITGSGSLTQTGTGDVGLNASNSYAGLTTVSAGRLFVANGNSLGSTAAGTVVSNGAELFITLNVNVDNEPLTVVGLGTGGVGGALHKGGAGVTTYGGAVTLLGDTMFNIDGGATLNLTNAAGVNGIAANANLQLAGSGAGNISGPILLGAGTVTNSGGVWTVSASNNYAGNTVISGGRYHIASPLSLGTQPGAWTPDRVLLTGGALGVTNDVNVALNDGRIGITLAGLEGQLAVNAGATLTVSNEISGTGNLAKWLPGLLILNGSNSFAGEFYTDRNSTFENDGTTRITRSDALQNVTAIGMRNNNAGFSTLQLDGSAGNITLPQPMTLSCRNNTNLCLQNLAGSNVLTGGISIQVGGADQWWQSDSGTLVYAADINYVGALTGQRNYHFQGAGNHLVTGNINVSPLGSPIAITKDGTGTLTLAGANTYGTTTAITNGTLLLTGSISHTGAVTVVGGTLAGTGTIDAGGGVTVLAGGTLSPGASIGTLTLNNNNLTLAGTTHIELNKTAGTRDQVVGINTASYGGTLVVTNLAGTLNIGDTFTIFSASFTGGNFSSIVNATGQSGIGFTFTPSTGVLTVVVGIPTSQPTLTNSVSGSTLSLTWPASHIGWILQSQTNALNVGISGTWTDVPGSAAVSSTNITINPANPTVFFRLRYP